MWVSIRVKSEKLEVGLAASPFLGRECFAFLRFSNYWCQRHTHRVVQ